MPKRAMLLAGLAVAASATTAVALEYCVTCEGPPAMYRCTIKDTADGPGKDPSVSLYCISQMAAKGGHKACAVSRGAPFPCPGLTAIIEQPKQLPTLAAPPPDAPVPHEDAAEAAPTEPAAAEPSKVPRTVEELANQTYKSSKEGVEKAGQAIGGTAKKAGEQIGNAGSAIGDAAGKTWTCITSLFSHCGGEEESQPPPAAPPAN